jgi:hypothetical protein
VLVVVDNEIGSFRHKDIGIRGKIIAIWIVPVVAISVIASAAKQSILAAESKNGLLRRKNSSQ